jgi:trans-2,3-dihydro-3-hydroxyanthranilate isomerase
VWSVRYHHVDVFTGLPYLGNSLAVFPDATGLADPQLGRITQELRHFESIFVWPDGDGRHWRARVFDLVDELAFAGHPVLGAACVLHDRHGGAGQEHWTLRLPARTVRVTTRRGAAGRFSAVLDQGPATFLGEPGQPAGELAGWFGLTEADLDPALPPAVVSTGLRYLLLPVRTDALARARIVVPDLAERLDALGAQFAYLLDADALEGRHWTNDGLIEDVATGSAAGCVAAYLRRHGRLDDAATATLRQGRFVGRPSEITIRAHGTGLDISSVEVGGDVVAVATGTLDRLPE